MCRGWGGGLKVNWIVCKFRLISDITEWFIATYCRDNNVFHCPPRLLSPVDQVPLI